MDLGEVFKNVRVVKFKIIEHRHFRKVMDKLATLIKERRVIFVALDDEPLAVREARALREIIGNASDEITRVESAVLEHPSE